MLKRINCVDSLPVVQAEQVLEKIKTFRLEMLAKALVNVSSLLLPVLLSFAARQRRPAGHVGFIWRADKLEDSHALINICAPLQNWLSFEHFAKNTSSGR